MGNGSIDYEILQIIYRWKALTEENPLEQLILKMVHWVSLTSKGKRVECIMQLNNLRDNWVNWRLGKHRVGPTIPLRRLLAQINFLLYVFHAEVGVHNRKR
jgi:hypothetical protein